MSRTDRSRRPGHPRRPRPDRQGEPARPPLAVRLVLVLAGAWLIWTGVDHALTAADSLPERVAHAVRALAVAGLAVPLVILARRVLDRRPWTGLGLDRGGGTSALLGAGLWVGGAALAAVPAALTGLIALGGAAPQCSTMLLALYLPVLVLLLEALPEELIFRGYVYRNLADALPTGVAVLAQSALFALWAVLLGAAATPDRVLLFLSFGYTMGMLRVVTGTVWAPIGFHVAFQTCAQYVTVLAGEGTLVLTSRVAFDVLVTWLVPIAVVGGVLTHLGAARGLRWRRAPDAEAGQTLEPARLSWRRRGERS